jgi:transcriptional regulator, XRE family
VRYLTTINARIKIIRKNANMNQKVFSEKIGVTQSGVSYMEQNGRNVSDITIKSICNYFNISEDWLRYGKEPMYTQPPTFSLDDFVKSKGATKLELEIMKTYFELDPEIRKNALEYFKRKLISSIAADPALLVPDTEEELEAQFPPINNISDIDAG